MKQAVLNLMLSAGAFVPFRVANRRRALVLMYHRFAERDGDAASKTPASVFARHLDYLAAHYRVVPLSLIGECVRGGGPLPPGAAAITIDDGYADAYRVAFPALRERRLPATLFVTTGFVDRLCWLWTDKVRYAVARTASGRLEAEVGGRLMKFELDGEAGRRGACARVNAALKSLPDEQKDETIARLAASLGVDVPALPPPEFEAVTWDEARELDAGGVRVESHTLTHPILTNVDDARLRRELRESKARLEGVLGRRVEVFCYPNGDADGRVRREAESAGYTCAVTDEEGLIDARRADPLALPRIPADPDFAHFVQSTSGFDELKNRLRGGRRAPGEARELSYG